jgi:tetratricopeptide (TPR) repeat protein
MNTPAPSSRPTIFVVLLLILLTVAVYWRVSQHEFLRYDDPDYVTMNIHVNQGVTSDGLAWAFGQTHGDFTYWHPLTWVSHMIDCQLFGLRPGPHHVVNLLFHIANVVLLFFVLKRVTAAFWPSAIVAALWAVHPLQVDTVAWVTERKNLLSALFWILAMGAYVRYAEKPGFKRYLPVFLAMSLGLMAKPILVTLPCALLLLDFWPLKRFQLAIVQNLPNAAGPAPQLHLPPQSLGRLFLEKLPLFALSIGSSILTIVAHEKLGSLLADDILPIGLRLESALVSYTRYLGKMFLPAGLAVFYPHPREWPTSQVVLSAVLLLAVTAFVLLLIRRAPALAVGWFWFLGVLLPTIGILQAGSQSIADRFMYLPLVGLLIAVVWGARAWLMSIRAGPTLLRAAPVILILACAATSNVQVRHWQNTYTLFSHALKVTECNYIAYAAVGTVLAENGRTAEAMPFFHKALECKPDHFECHIVLGNALVAQQKYEEAIEHYRQAVKVNPRSAEGYNGWGIALVRIGQAEQGLAKLDEALKINPHLAEAHFNRAIILQRAGRLDDAAAASREVRRLQSTNTVALMILGNGFITHRRFTEALQLFQHLLHLDPDNVEALDRVAWIFSTHEDARIRNGPEALRLATHANRLTGQRHAPTLNVLAAAYAETGQFSAATATAQQALQLAQESGQSELAAIIQKLLDLYKAGTPYRDQ